MVVHLLERPYEDLTAIAALAPQYAREPQHRLYE